MRSNMSSNQCGNVLFIILIGLVLFAALGFAVTQSGKGTGKIDREQESLLITEMMQYASNMNTTVASLRLSRCSDVEISFDSTETGATYDNPFAPASGKCNVFSSVGGPLPFKRPDTRLLDSSMSAQPLYGTYFVTGHSSVVDLGTSPACGPTLSTGKELMVIVPYVKKSVCEAIAQRTNGMDVGNTLPKDLNDAWDHRAGLSQPFKGVYGADCDREINEATNPALLNGQKIGCFEGENMPPTGAYSFFQVFLVR